MSYYPSIIIGAGPAGLQMAYFLKRQGEAYIVIESSKHAGSFFSVFPRNRRLISINKPNCGNMNDAERVRRFDWNSLITLPEDDFQAVFRDYSDDYYPNADKLVEYLRDFEKCFQLDIVYNTTVTSVKKVDQDLFSLVCLCDKIERTFTAARVFIATGLQPNHLTSDFKTHDFSKEQPNFYFYDTMPLAPEYYRNKSVLIIGGGNAAFETANYLNPFCNELTIQGADRFAYNTHYPGNIRSINMPLLDSYYLKMNVNLDWARTKFAKHDPYVQRNIEGVKDGSIFSTYDVVLCCAGFQPAVSYIDNKLISRDEKGFPITTAMFESVCCKNLFFIGALSQQHDYKKGTSAFIHGFRYNCRIVYEHIFKKQAVQSFETSPHGLRQIVEKILYQINNSSALFHRFDFVGDYILVTQSKWIFVQCQPVNHIKESSFDVREYTNDNVLAVIIMTLGYNRDRKFKRGFRQPQVGSLLSLRDESVFIHPRFSIYTKCQTQKWDKIYTFKLPENAFNIFNVKHLHIDVVSMLVSFLNEVHDRTKMPVTYEHMYAFESVMSRKF